jgi:hypothetical protein
MRVDAVYRFLKSAASGAPAVDEAARGVAGVRSVCGAGAAAVRIVAGRGGPK